MSPTITLDRPKIALRFRVECLDCVGPSRPFMARDELSALRWQRRHEFAADHDVVVDAVMVVLDSGD